MKRASRAFALIAFLLTGFAGAPAFADSALEDEAALKAAYVYNFILFAHWPYLPGDAIHLCVLARGGVEAELLRLDGREVQGGRSLMVRSVKPGEPFAGCQVLFLDEGNRRVLDTLLYRLIDLPVLTVADGAGFVDKGVMIEMRRVEQRVVFDVNLTAARRVSLDFSPRMLRLAKFVAYRN